MKAILQKFKTNYDLTTINKDNHIETFASTDSTFENKLSKQNCDEIFGVVDVEKLAEKYCTHEPKNAKELRDVNLIKLGFRDGFNKAMELNKMFTLEDMRNSFISGFLLNKGTNPRIEFEIYIQSLQQPTEIEVEIEMICPHPEDAYRCGLQYGCDTECYHPHKIPYLDSEGCLILTKKI